MEQKAQVIVDYDYYKDLLEFEKAVKENTIISFQYSDYFGVNFTSVSQVDRDVLIENIVKQNNDLREENRKLKEKLEKYITKSFFRKCLRY